LSDISITYDLLFDILRTEKSRDELQKLDEKFYSNVVDYINSKESVINNPNTPHSERELTRIQLGNVKKLLIELYDRREKKILNLAVYKIKTSSGMINTEGLLDEEKHLFDKIYSELSKNRAYVIGNVLDGKMSLIEPEMTVQKPRPADIITAAGSDVSDTMKSVRFIKPVPKFLGPELEVYGPFEENDIASLPSKISNILVSKGRAEEMHIEQ